MEKTKTLYMETTKLDATKTCAEIQYALAQAGATGVGFEYNPTSKQPISVAFKLEINGKEYPFLLPVRVEPLFVHINKKRSVATRFKKEKEDLEQATRVAWRQILKWVQAQLALIETGMVDVEEVFLPYIQVNSGRTLYSQLKAGDFKGLLTDGGKL